jgi:hypothetical protein
MVAPDDFQPSVCHYDLLDQQFCRKRSPGGVISMR